MVLTIIISNILVLFTQGYYHPGEKSYHILSALDFYITLFFLVELIAKVNLLGIRKYLQSGWNKLDFLLIVLAIPSGIKYLGNLEGLDLSFLLALRVLRVFKTLRLFKFIPNIAHLITGFKRAIKASFLVAVAMFLIIILIGILSFYMFKSWDHEAFKNPLISIYSIFKVFTVEGWYELPDSMASGKSRITEILIHIYFSAIVLGGGIIGLSIVNSIFVDTMVSDNNDDLSEKINNIETKLDQLIKNQLSDETRENS
ncbi:ion transporter [Luteibaculum oceani]|uniref:ion transporter n=1 Tax=Luteibaculum oceani TaxID=1294296 RepID=UPI001CB9CA1C|nr:ion transporter [Luteibaculum oceani]